MDIDSFCVGVLRKCAEHGLTADQTADVFERMTDAIGNKKTAGVDLSTLWNNPLYNMASGAISGAAGYAAPLAIAAPPILGAAAGYGLAKATDFDDVSPDEIKKRELVDEYRRQREIWERKQRNYQQHMSG